MTWQAGSVHVLLSREQLYALVWTEPVRTLAQKLGISDVALAKHCRKHDVPVPSRGYWAKLEAGKPVNHFKLKPSDLYTQNHVRLSGKPGSGLADHAKALAAEHPEPSVEELRDRLVKRLGHITTPKTLKDPHRDIRALITRDEALRASSNSWERPIFASPFQQRRLRILNGIFLGMAKVGGVGRISGYQASNIRLQVGSHHLEATLEPARGRGLGKFSPTWSKEANPECLSFSLLNFGDTVTVPVSWRDQDDTPLEDRVTEIIIGLGVAAETRSRESRRRHEAWLIKRAAEEAEEARKRQIELERQRQERLADEAKARLDALLRDADNLARAERLRAYVARILANAPVGIPRDQLETWSAYVRDQADRIDPQTSGRLAASISEAKQAEGAAPCGA